MKTTTLHLISGLLLLLGSAVTGSITLGIPMLVFGVLNIIRGFQNV